MIYALPLAARPEDSALLILCVMKMGNLPIVPSTPILINIQPNKSLLHA